MHDFVTFFGVIVILLIIWVFGYLFYSYIVNCEDYKNENKKDLTDREIIIGLEKILYDYYVKVEYINVIEAAIKRLKEREKKDDGGGE